MEKIINSKYLFCFGTRPEAIKMAPVIHELKKQKIIFKVCVTAQHREMLDQVLDFFEITPDYDLDLMKAGQTLNGLSSSIFSGIDEVFDDWLGLRQAQSDRDGLRRFDKLHFDRLSGAEGNGLRQAQSGLRQAQSGLRQAQSGLRQAQSDKQGLRRAQSDMVLVHGDTTTASMIAQAAFHRQIKVGHVEAGLRTYNKTSPFPEEINRQLISRIADVHFTPTERANTNLLKEGIPAEQIILTGNTVVDALHWAAERLSGKELAQEIIELKTLLNNEKKLILVTGHRRENFGEGLEEIGEALLELSSYPDVEIIYPVHLNPNVKHPVQKMLGNKPDIHLVSPVAYPTMLWLMQRAEVIISDSGGIQEEAPAFGKPVLVTREFSERMEGVEAGFSVLVGTNRSKIVEQTTRLLNNPPDLKKKPNPYGDGKAAERIVGFLKDLY
ncbi:non-hydrolyzing UDP-N-acetylglucosamine 2-epimerase [Autumnicola psychrophila]|uniref:UDP-N-acetylglucosamine 2-epimerase (non-hydrolyzing) n=1 Tax=Autumnicola psychrophila TaxID=3075592 RepID=A0ABU3DUS7_9FLAO|nr:UDP-N-acetylglucosamine 2-epimerase (non-hydrolyzing) [Zunongwangia sp. F225]MDT0686847.1 UDP-N-acetylglucosamine 2-epimerase (non-hydrolyzing) [Zunongwangia sp. F225]